MLKVPRYLKLHVFHFSMRKYIKFGHDVIIFVCSFFIFFAFPWGGMIELLQTTILGPVTQLSSSNKKPQTKSRKVFYTVSWIATHERKLACCESDICQITGLKIHIIERTFKSFFGTLITVPRVPEIIQGSASWLRILSEEYIRTLYNMFTRDPEIRFSGHSLGIKSVNKRPLVRNTKHLWTEQALKHKKPLFLYVSLIRSHLFWNSPVVTIQTHPRNCFKHLRIITAKNKIVVSAITTPKDASKLSEMSDRKRFQSPQYCYKDKINYV